MLNLPKKILCLISFIIFFFIFTQPVRAAQSIDGGGGGSDGYGGYFDENFNSYTEGLKVKAITGEVDTNGFVTNFFNTAINVWLYKANGPACETGQTCQAGGVLGSVSKMVTYLCLNPPASGAEYLADLGQSFGLAKPAYAQGIGFKYFSPILPIWKITRNLAYLAFVIIFIITGLAIMFRVKISPQAVLTMESALPKVVVALILVTFSYAIAGFMIDLVYVLIGVVLAVFKADLSEETIRSFSGNPTISIFISWYSKAGGSFASELAGGLGQTVEDLPILGGLPVIGGKIAGGLAHLILIIALIFAFFKLFFALLMCYINIILAIILGPLTIMLSALPGEQTNSFTKWLQGLLANILVFPAVIGVFTLAELIKNATNSNVTQIWSPPLLFSTNSAFVGGLISFGLLMLAPQIPSYIKAMFNPKEKVMPPSAAFLGGVAGGLGIADAGYGKLFGQKAAIAEDLYAKGGGTEAGYGQGMTKPPISSWWRKIPKSLTGQRR